MAAIATSQPLFPCFVPLRYTACSMESAVTTPNITGTPVCSDALATPFDTSDATY